MQKARLATAVAAAILSTTAFAADNGSAFDGVYAGAALGTVSSEYDFTITGKGLTVGLSADDESRASLFAGLGKTFDQWYLGAELGWYDTMGAASTVVANGLIEVEGDAAKGVSVLPGFLATPELLLYTRLAYLKGDTDTTLTNTNNGLGLTQSDSGTITGWGLGGRFAINDNLSVRAEYVQYDGDDTNYVIDVPLEVENADSTAMEIGIVYSF